MPNDEEEFAHWAAMGERIRSARGKGTRRSIAKQSDLSEGYVRQIEQGFQIVKGTKLPISPSANAIRALAEAVGIDPSDLLQQAGFNLSPEESAALGRPDISIEEIAHRIHELVDELVKQLK